MTFSSSAKIQDGNQNWEIQHFSEALHVTSLVPTGFKICSWRENDFWGKVASR